MKKYSKEEAIEIVVSCAEAYSRELLNKSLLFVCQDIRNIVGNWARVILVYRKEITEERYSEITYAAKKTEWDKITFPEQYQYLPKPQFVGQK